MIPAARRGAYTDDKRAIFDAAIRPIRVGFAAADTTDERTHAFATQGAFGCLESGEVGKGRELVEISRQTRPQNKRGHATEPLLDLELARADHRLEEARRLALDAVNRLLQFPLPRHLQVAGDFGYLTV